MSHTDLSKERFQWRLVCPILLAVYVAYILVCAFTPFTFSVDSSKSLFHLISEGFDPQIRIWSIPTWDIVSNIILFLPWGFLFVSLPGVGKWNASWKLFVATFTAGLLSFMFEMGQLFLPRAPSLLDILLNVAGGGMGAVLGVHFERAHCQWLYRRLLSFQRNRWLPLFLFCYVVFLLGMAGLPLPLSATFSNWDADYPIQLGNEATLDRPWQGKIFLVALYDRPLTHREIATNLSSGPSACKDRKRSREGLVVLYDFCERTGTVIHDRSRTGHPLNLHIDDPKRMNWIEPNGIRLTGNTIASSKESAKTIHGSHIVSKSLLTLETWIASADDRQAGPARIVSYSANTSLRNFTLAQDKNNIVFRLRTTLSGLNGTRPQLETREGLLTTGLHHVVVTYRDGAITLYVDGRKREEITLNREIYVFERIDELLNFKYRWVYWFPIIFTLGCVSYIALTKKWKRSILVIALCTCFGVAVLGALEWFQVMNGQRAYEAYFLPIGTAIFFFAVLTTSKICQIIQSS